MSQEKIKVAILGAGPAALAAAWELSGTPELRERYAITLYEQGFRAGGKCSGLRRPPHDTIEQNGTHYLFGCYDNALDLMQQAYAELRAAGDESFGSFDRELIARHRMVFRHEFRGEYHDWSIELPANDLPPGLGEGELDLLSRRHLATLMAWIWSSGVSQLSAVLQRPELASSAAARRVYGSISRLLSFAPVGNVTPERLQLTATLLGRFRALVYPSLRPWLSQNLAVHRAWALFDIAATCLIGLVRDDVQAPTDLARLDDVDLRAWLEGHGACQESLGSAPLRGWYDAVAAYQDGDVRRPSIAAGVSLYALGRALLTYRGALFYSLRREVADGFIAPICGALQRRGVKFAYFHRVWELVPDVAGERLDAVELERQAQLQCGDPCGYQPFIDVKGNKAWPAEPLRDQLLTAVGQESLHSFYTSRQGAGVRLERGRDFDELVFALPLPTASTYCRRLLEQKPAWQRAVAALSSVETQSLRLYLNKSPEQLGWRGKPGILSAFVPPFSTWEDNSHSLESQAWPPGQEPASVVSLFGALPGEATAPPHDDCEYEARKLAQARAQAVAFLQDHGAALWPGACSTTGSFDFETLVDLQNRSGVARLDAQYVRANVGPCERYTTATAGSLRHRLAPGDSGYRGFYVAGDWTAQATGTGSVEGAVLSGRAAARALLSAASLGR